ncbi:MAG: type II toxin-antitoxin system prevent-host-death family antitoxin [Verrucomicrobiales bacterium]|nr:type II toxin-antitoxin system prevent-host-death family antitoxin [Verrucomicrobiales bacterium]
MQVASIASAKNQLSKLLKCVQRGESVLITDRHQPVAQLVPVDQPDKVIAGLVSQGRLTARKGAPLDPRKLFALPAPDLPERASLSRAVIEERGESR